MAGDDEATEVFVAIEELRDGQARRVRYDDDETLEGDSGSLNRQFAITKHDGA
jgi:hypothetical protein